MDKNQFIFGICRIVRSIEASSGLGDLDLTSRSILSFIGEAEAENRTLHVSDVVRGRGFGTAPTVFSRLAELERTGWIKSTPDPSDGRAKQVQLTPMARRTYARMSREALKIGISKASR